MIVNCPDHGRQEASVAHFDSGHTRLTQWCCPACRYIAAEQTAPISFGNRADSGRLEPIQGDVG